MTSPSEALATDEDRALARAAVSALRAAIADPTMMGDKIVCHIDLSRPRRGVWVTTWANLPGFSLTNGAFRHTLLPGWEYQRWEVRSEMIPDLEALAIHGVRPTKATR